MNWPLRWHWVIRKHRERQMHSHRFAGLPSGYSLSASFLKPREMQSQEGKTKYPRRAPVEEYLMPDRNAEMALARSAASESISHEATVLVPGAHSYETAVEG